MARPSGVCRPIREGGRKGGDEAREGAREGARDLQERSEEGRERGRRGRGGGEVRNYVPETLVPSAMDTSSVGSH